jgi:tetratricopeptide (TPR) repeat protein
MATAADGASRAVSEGVQRRPDVNPAAYASFASAAMLHARSDALLTQLQSFPFAFSETTPEERKRMEAESAETWRQAVEMYRKTLLYDPKSIAACESLARGYFERGDMGRGLEWLKRAAQADKRDFLLLYRLGLLCERSKQVREAIQAFEEAEKARDDADKTKLLPLVLLKLGRLYESQDKPDEAAAAYSRFLKLKREEDRAYEGNALIIELMKNPAPLYNSLGELYGRVGRHKDAVGAFAEALRLQPQTTQTMLKLAEAHKNAKDYAEAARTCKEFIEKEPDRLDGMSLLIEIHKDMGQLDAAIVAARTFLKEKPLLYQLHYMLGTLYEEKKDVDKAIAEYGVIVSGKKRFGPAYRRLARLEAAAGRPEKALAVLARGLSGGMEDEVLDEIDRRVADAADVPDIVNRFRLSVEEADQDFAFYCVLGRLCQASKKNAEAVEAYREAMRLRPDFLYCYVRLAQVHIVEDKAEEAVKVMREATQMDPRNVLALRFLADVCLAAGDVKAAVDAMKRVVYLDPSSVPGTLYLVGLMHKAGQGEEAERFLRQGLERHPEDAERWTFLLAGYYIDHNIRLDEAAALLESALEDYPESSRLTEALGFAHLRRRDYAKAVGALEQAAKLNPGNVDTRLRLSLAFERDRKPADAERVLREALKAAPDDADVQVGLGRFLVRTKRDPAGGLALVERASAANPDDAGIRLALGGTYLELKRHGDAVALFTEMLRKAPTDVSARYQLAMAYDDMDQFGNAERELLRILESDPKDPMAANALGYLYAEHSMKLDEAQKLVGIALEHEPGNGAYLDSMGWVFYKKGDLPKALEYLAKALELESDAVIAEHLGDVYVRTGRKDLAVERYEEAARIDPENVTAPKKIRLLKAGKDPLADEK